MTFAFAVDVSAGVDIGAILRKVLRDHQAKHVSVWADCQMDGAQFSRALEGNAPLDLWKLRGMDERMFVDFLTGIAVAVVHRCFDRIQVPLRMARAELHPSDRKDGVA